MTLEDFFTLTEMKDGLTAPARVEELIAVMQKEKDCAVKNIGDATRQWSAVSSTIAATDNRDCLDLFIKLDGLWFIDKWLKDAQKFDTHTSEIFGEEAITAMLGALEKLHIDNDRSTSSGIWITVKNLIGHNSSRIQDKARELCDHWHQSAANDIIHKGVEIVEACHDDEITVSANHAVEGGEPACIAIDAPLSNDCAEEENGSVEPMRDEVLPSKSSGGLQAENFEVAQSHLHSNHLNSHPTLGDRDSLPAFREKTSTPEEPPISAVETTASVESCTSAPEQCSVRQICPPNLAESTKDTNNSHDKSGVIEASGGSSMLECRAVDLGADVANVQESAGKPAVQNNVATNEVEELTLNSEPNSGVDDIGAPNDSNTFPSKTTCQKAESCTVLQESSGKEHVLSTPMDGEPSFSKTENCKSPSRDEDTPSCFESEALDVFTKMKMEDSGSVYKEKECVGDADENHISTPKSTKPVKGVRNLDSVRPVKGSRKAEFTTKTAKGARNKDFTKPIKDFRRPDIELEYDIMDALAVARQVAQEVEREVEDYRGPSCSSSSDKASDGEPGTPDSINIKEDEPISGSRGEMSDRQSLSSEEYLQGGESRAKSDSMDTEPESYLPDMESSQVTEAAQEPEAANSEQGDMCGFDLNREVFSDDMDRQVNAISTLISVVSASRPAASPGLPVAPLQFEGTLGWKGSALTSAFRPAPPRRISDGGGSSHGSKCRQDHLDIDLNVAEGEEDKFGDLTSGKQRHTSFGLHSGESSVEISSKKPERLKFDLNCIDDDADEFKKEEHPFRHQNGRRSPSPVSSSSAVQPSMRNIDLNDRPFIQNDSSVRGPYLAKPWQNISAHGSTKPDEPVISIMGTRVEVKRKDYVPQTISLFNGKSPEFSMDANAARTAAFLGMGPTPSYPQPPAFGYNGITAGPAMSFPSSMYGTGGPISYMVDSRGAPVLGSLSPYSQQQPFIMNMTGASMPLNGVGPSRPGFDLNSGFVIDGGNRDAPSLRQFFVPGQGRSMEEHSRTNMSSVIGTKRKEPDGGWEPYPFIYKHQQQQPPWK